MELSIASVSYLPALYCQRHARTNAMSRAGSKTPIRALVAVAGMGKFAPPYLMAIDTARETAKTLITRPIIQQYPKSQNQIRSSCYQRPSVQQWQSSASVRCGMCLNQLLRLILLAISQAIDPDFNQEVRKGHLARWEYRIRAIAAIPYNTL